jgi:hypothetical protein
MSAAFHFAPLVGWALWLAFAAAALAVWMVAAWRRARGAGWRLAALAVLLAALANPRLVVEERSPLPDIVLVVVDESRSQSVADRPRQTEAAVEAIRSQLARFPGLEVRIERVGDDSDGTRMMESIGRALADIPHARLAALIAVTDGRVHDAQIRKSLPAPLHVLLTGSPSERDRRIGILNQPGFALVGKNAAIRVKVDDPGHDQPVTLDVRVDGTQVASRQVAVNRPITIEFPVQHAGANVVELAADEAEGELTTRNNRLAVTVSGVRDRLKVLLVSGQPHAGERMWRNLLKSDPAVDLVHFTILRPPEKDDQTPIRELSLITFPVRELFEERLKDFDLVVFDRYSHRGILSESYYRQLADYVRKGGALLAAVGPEFAQEGGIRDSALADILPALPTGQVIERAFRPQPTPAGQRHPVTAALPGRQPDGGWSWGAWVRHVQTGPARGQVLLSGADGNPLLILDRVGEGRVGLLTSDSAWLWARGFEGGGPHGELLRRTAHWLMKEPDLEEESLAADIRSGSLHVIRRSLAPPPPSVRITRPDGTQADVPLHPQDDGTASAQTTADQPGVWRVDDGILHAVTASGGADLVEMSDLTTTQAPLAGIVAASQGSFRYLSQDGIPEFRRVAPLARTWGPGWAGLVKREQHAVTGARDVPLFFGALIFFLSIGAFVAAWWREGR